MKEDKVVHIIKNALMKLIMERCFSATVFLNLMMNMWDTYYQTLLRTIFFTGFVGEFI